MLDSKTNQFTPFRTLSCASRFKVGPTFVLHEMEAQADTQGSVFFERKAPTSQPASYHSSTCVGAKESGFRIFAFDFAPKRLARFRPHRCDALLASHWHARNQRSCVHSAIGHFYQKVLLCVASLTTRKLHNSPQRCVSTLQ